MRFVRSSKLVIVLAFALLSFSAPAGADPAAAAPSAIANVQDQICTRLFHAVSRLVTNLAERLSKSDAVDLNINSITMDARHRVYIDLDGMLELNFQKPHPKVEAKMLELAANQLQTNGPLSLDLLITEVEKQSDTRYHVEFKASLILVLEDILMRMVKYGSEIAGTVTLFGIGSDLCSFAEGLDTPALAESLGKGLQDLTRVVMSLAGVETYNAWRELRPDRAGDGDGGSVTGAVLAHLALAILKGAGTVATNVAGMTIGATLGVALVPGVGATIGGIIGGVGMVIVGNVVYKKATINLPIRYRLHRLRHLFTERLAATDESRSEWFAAKMEKYETKILKRVSLDMRIDNYHYLTVFMEQVRASEPKEREAYLPLCKKLQDKLRFEVVQHQDRLAQRMLDQLTGAMSAPE